jgi:hypothetical protein
LEDITDYADTLLRRNDELGRPWPSIPGASLRNVVENRRISQPWSANQSKNTNSFVIDITVEFSLIPLRGQSPVSFQPTKSAVGEGGQLHTHGYDARDQTRHQ